MTAWILQVKGGEKPQFRLEEAISEALKRDRTLWLAPLKILPLESPESPGKGDRFYLNISGEKAPGSSRVGKLVAIATALDKPLPHDMPTWQKEFLTSYGLQEHKSESPRLHLYIDALIHPVLGREEVCNADQEVQTRQCFYQLRNGSNVVRGTTCFVDGVLDDLLARLCQDRLTSVACNGAGTRDQIPLSEDDARKRVLREVTERSGQGLFRQTLLREGNAACAFSGTPVTEVLEAAHIMPYRGIQTDDPNNGLLLRADIHKLFDRGLLRITPKSGQIEIAPVLIDSVDYKELNGRLVCNWQRLRQDALEWRWKNSDLSIWARA